MFYTNHGNYVCALWSYESVYSQLSDSFELDTLHFPLFNRFRTPAVDWNLSLLLQFQQWHIALRPSIQKMMPSKYIICSRVNLLQFFLLLFVFFVPSKHVVSVSVQKNTMCNRCTIQLQNIVNLWWSNARNFKYY